MKRTHYSVLFLTLFISANTIATQPNTTDQYAYGAEIKLSNSESMFSKLVLDNDIYLQTTSPYLQDICIFNRNGQIVPFTLVNESDSLQDIKKFDMEIYPLNQVSTPNENRNDKNNYALSIQGQDINISVDKPNDEKAKYVATYLLQIPNDQDVNVPVSNLKLSFDPQDNWQATANLAYSDNLKNWRDVVDNVPIMTLTNSNKNTLILNDISFQSYSSYKGKNWLITLYSQNPIPTLKTATASSLRNYTSNTLFPINFSVDRIDDHTVIYSLPTTRPIKELTIDLNTPRSVLPVSIYYKKNNTDNNWIKLEDRIIRKTNYGDEPTRLTFNNQLMAQIKFEAMNSSFENTPKVTAYRNKIDVIFNSANNAPFILAWGSAAAKPAALNESSLLSEQDDITNIPYAYIDKEIQLSGEKALTTQKNEQSSGIPQWVIWLGLIAGAAVLVVLAIKLTKEIKKQ